MTVPKAESTDMIAKTPMERGRDDSSNRIRRYAVRTACCITKEPSGTDVHSTRVVVPPSTISGASCSDGFAFALSTSNDQERDMPNVHALGRGVVSIVRLLCSNRSYFNGAWRSRAPLSCKHFSVRSDGDRRFRLHLHASQFDRHRYWNASSNAAF